MDTTSTPNLKPFRDYSEHEVINLFSHESGSVNKGTFVAVSTAAGNTNVMDNAGSPPTPHLDYEGDLHSGIPARAMVKRSDVHWKVATAAHDDNVLGVMLYDVSETNAFGEKYMFRPAYERVEKQVVLSGEAVPVLMRGIIKTNGFTGAPTPGDLGVIASGTDGILTVSTDAALNVCGKFLTTPDADGYALFKVEL